MKYTIILNPAAGNGVAARKWPAIEQALQQAGVAYELVETERPSHASEIAYRAGAESDVVVAVGGDGTIHEVTQGLITGGGRAALAVIPMGTGNDFVKMIGARADGPSIAETLLSTPVSNVDYGIVRWWQDGGEQEHVFVNAVGIGFDAQVAHEVARFKGLPGVMGYLVAALKTLRSWPSPSARVTLQCNAMQEHYFEGPIFFVTAANGVCSGGGFYLTPNARVDDGLLDVCLVRKLSLQRVMVLIPKALFGKHTGAREVKMDRVTRVVIEASCPLPVHADGEVLTRAASRVEVDVVRHGLRVLAPRIGVRNGAK